MALAAQGEGLQGSSNVGSFAIITRKVDDNIKQTIIKRFLIIEWKKIKMKKGNKSYEE
jgi:hypothetical protein